MKKECDTTLPAFQCFLRRKRRADRGLENEREQQPSSQELERKTLILYKAEDERPLLTKYVCHYTTSNSFHNAFSKEYLAQG